MSILDSFTKAFVINLPHREDRRRETRSMFNRIGLPDWERHVEFFPAIRPDSAGNFPTLGTRGCFLSHLGVLKRALEEKAANVLVMEDDLEIEPDFVRNGHAIAKILRAEPWGFAYFGHRLEGQISDSGRPMQSFDGPIVTAHFVAISGQVLPRVVAHLEEVLDRPLGHPDGGPMHVDGAYSMFRERNPDVRTLVATPSLGFQRNSASDITTRWFDQVPVLASMAGAARRMMRRTTGRRPV